MIRLILQVLAASAGTVGFSLLFGVPVRYYTYCGLIGGIGWLVYLCVLPGTTATIATFCATVVIILLSRWFAVRKRCPATLFLISGIFPLVPGAGIYWAAYYTITNQLQLALETGYGAVKTAVAIVLGIVVVFELPEKWFHLKTV
ncbi:threonine/serine exporter [Clostridiaceae bacterium]|jgi:uncharacterized membrane protein YjjB (DUF3815 family)|nr:threonine/serine exporter [Lachnospiraceae bacterium]NBH16688.1 threonine/serine exporter [Clostridiaceae bacterium]